jgi:hypothetical protein
VLSELMRSFRGGYAGLTMVVVEPTTEDQAAVRHQSPGGGGGNGAHARSREKLMLGVVVVEEKIAKIGLQTWGVCRFDIEPTFHGHRWTHLSSTPSLRSENTPCLGSSSQAG